MLVPDFILWNDASLFDFILFNTFFALFSSTVEMIPD